MTAALALIVFALIGVAVVAAPALHRWARGDLDWADQRARANKRWAEIIGE